MKTCQWHKCGVTFEPTKPNQNYCKPEHRHAHNNYLKMTGVHFIPLAYDYMKSIAESRIPAISVDEIANEMILRHMDIDERQLKKHERPGEYYRAIQGITPAEAI